MPGIEREPVIPDVTAIAARVVGPFAVVAVETQRLQRAEAKGVPVSAVRWMVVGDAGGNDPTLSQALGAERLATELITSPFAPAS